jgi:hypothetical protein
MNSAQGVPQLAQLSGATEGARMLSTGLPGGDAC